MGLLRVENISKSYKRGFLHARAQVLSDITMSIKKGQNLGLIGHSGAGKTTLAKIIVGLIKADSGRIFFNSENSSNSRVQMVFQDYAASLNPRMNAKAILSEPFKLTGLGVEEVNKHIKQLLPKVSVEEDWLTKYPHQFSGGQKQRLAIARAIALNPKIVILDEPFSSQDVLTRNEILLLLKKLQQEFDVTFLLISHDLALVKHFCKQIVLISNGKIVE